MNDPNYMYALMHGEVPQKKTPGEVEMKVKSGTSQFDNDLEKKIDSYVDELELEEDPTHKSLVNAKAKRESIRLEIKEAIKLPELSKNINTAMEIIFNEGKKYLSPESAEILTRDFSNAAEILDQLTIEGANVNLQELTKISDESMKSLVEIAIAKFSEANYVGSLSLFSLLTILNPSYSEYWFRFGLAAQKCEQLELASRAYAAALELDPNLLGAKVFGAECFLSRNLKEEARTEILAAKKMVEENATDPMWLELIANIEASLK